jgi:ribosomal protein L1
MNFRPANAVPSDEFKACIDTVNTATLDGDFDSARLCLAQLREKLTSPRLDALRQASDRLMRVLGPAGATPSPGLGRALVDLADAFDRIRAG